MEDKLRRIVREIPSIQPARRKGLPAAAALAWALGMCVLALGYSARAAAAAPIRQVPNPPESGVSFLQSGALTLSLPDEAAQAQVEVALFSGSTQSQTLSLRAARLLDSDEAPLPVGALLISPATQPVAAAGLVTFTLELQRLEGLADEYSGELVALSSDGSLARLPVSLHFVSAASPPIPAESDGIDPAYLESYTLRAVNLWPSILPTELGGAVLPVGITVNHAFSQSASLTVGQIASEAGKTASLRLHGNRLEVVGLGGAGKYSGKADLNPGDQEAGELALTVSVRDHGLYALLALIAGLLLAGVLERMLKYTLPLNRLLLKLSTLIEETCRDQLQVAASYPRQGPYGRRTFKIYQPNPRKGLLADAAQKIEANFREARSDAEREKWAATGDEFKKVEGYRNTFQSMLSLGRETAVYYADLKNEIERSAAMWFGPSPRDPLPSDAPDEVEMLPVAKELRAALKPVLILDAFQLEACQRRLQNAAAFAQKFRQVFIELITLRARVLAVDPPDEDDLAKVNGLLNQLLSPEMSSLSRLVELELRVGQTALELFPRSQVELAGKVMEGERGADAARERFMPPPFDLLGDLEQLARGVLSPPGTLADVTPEAVRKTLRRQEFGFQVVASLVVVATGFYTVYLPNATFGTWQDYFSALLWGTTVSAGLQLARQITPFLKVSA